MPTYGTYLNPFSTSSIWNRPVSASAVFAVTNINMVVTSCLHSWDQYIVKQVFRADPLVNVHNKSTFTMCGGGVEGTVHYQIPLPNGYVNNVSEGNNIGCFVEVDHLTVPNRINEGYLWERCSAGASAAQFASGSVALGGERNSYTTSSSGLMNGNVSVGAWRAGSIGGVIRSGELTSPIGVPIPHALRLVLPPSWLYYNGTGYRWPAKAADGYASQYSGSAQQLMMGSLLAIPPDVTETSLGMETEPGKKLFNAMRTYGGYVVDTFSLTSFQSNIAWCLQCETHSSSGLTVKNEFFATYGIDLGRFSSGNGWTGFELQFHRDIVRIVNAMRVVSNNAPGDTTFPTCSITTPTNGATVSGTTTVTASASDNVGVSGVQFKLNGSNLGSEDTTSPYTINWNTTTVANGSHILTAVARDAANNQTQSSAITVTVNNAPPPPPPPAATLIAAYSFNEGSGTTIADTSGNNHTGTINGATWSSLGKYGNCLSFDGVDDYVLVADANDLDLTTGMTIEAWVFPTSAQSGYRSVCMKEHVYYLFYRGSNGFPYGAARIASGGVVFAFGTSALPLNTWSHIATTYDGVTLKFFLNGTEVSNRPTTTNIQTSTSPLWIGASSVFGENFQGRIDDLRIYNGAISAANIQSDMNTPVASPPDITVPVISSVASSNLTSASARITWTTNEASDTQVEYGLTTSYGTSSTLNSSLVTSHTVDITGLNSSTTYHYRVKSRDVANNLATSGDFTFQTAAPADVTPPVISSISTSNVTATSATITWTTNEASTTQVEYGLTASYGTSTTLDATLVTSHSVGLTGLTEGTTYHYRVKSRDGAGNLANSADQTLGTPAAPDTQPPIISSVANTNPTSTATTVTWSTNELSTSQIEYGQTTSYGSSTAFDSTLVLSHSVALTGLTPQTLYHYRVKSLDAADNLAVSSDFSFVTAPPPDTTPAVISNGAPSGTLAAGTTDVTLTCSTNEAATCKYSTTLGVLYGNMTGTFSITGGTSHSADITGLTNSQTYNYYIRSQDQSGNQNIVDYVVTFSIANPPPPPPPSSITVVVPNGIEKWKIGKEKLIQWSSVDVNDNVKIELIRDGVVSLIFDSIPNNGTASFVVFGPKSKFCQIKVSSVNDPNISDISNSFFEIF